MGTKTYDNANDLITFSRASGGTALRKISYGSELVTNGTFDTDTSGWTVTVGTGTITASGGYAVVSRDAAASGYISATYAFSTVVGKVYSASGSLVATDGTPVVIGKSDSPTSINANRVDIYGGLSGTAVLGSGQEDFVATATTTYINLFLVDTGGPSVVTSSFDNISVKEVLFDQPDGTLTLFNHPDNIPRIDYNPDGTVKGLLVEEARTNLFTYSNDFTDASWSAVGANKTSANVFTAINLSNAHAVVFTFSTTSGETYTYQQKLTYDNNQFVSLRMFAGIFPHVCFDLINGTIAGTETGASGTITDIGNDEFLCSITVTATSTGTGNAGVFLQPSATNFGSAWLAAGTERVIAKHAQLEAGSFPTSYIPTSGSTATRAADIASIPVTDFGYNQDQGSLFVEVLTPAVDQFLLGPAYFNTTSFQNSRGFTKAAATNFVGGDRYVFAVYDGASTTINLADANTGQFVKLAGSYNGAENAAADGGSVSEGTTRSPSPSHLRIGGRDDGFQSQCWIKSIQYYPRRLTNTQLQELTT